LRLSDPKPNSTRLSYFVNNFLIIEEEEEEEKHEEVAAFASRREFQDSRNIE